MESAKVYPLKRNRLERSAAVTAPATPAKPKLLDQVRQAIRTRHYSPRTEETYVHWIERFIFFHNKRHPAEMAEAEIAAADDVVSRVQPAHTAGSARRFGSSSYIGARSFWHCRCRGSEIVGEAVGKTP